MNFRLQTVLICSLLSSTAFAQAPPPFPIPQPPLPGQSPSIILMPAPGVRGAPFSAVVEQEIVQTLTDGTQIDHKFVTARVARDSEGRTRIETLAHPPGPASNEPLRIQIFDPIIGEQYMILAHTYAANRSKFSLSSSPPSMRPPLPDDEAGRGAAPGGSFGTAVGGDGLNQSTTPSESSRPKTVTEHLERQEIEGLAAEGTRTTTTYPAGAQGNDRPFVVVRDMWRSPEFQITVLIRATDPRSGELIVRLTDIDRFEPDPALFRVPVGYGIVDPSPPQ